MILRDQSSLALQGSKLNDAISDGGPATSGTNTIIGSAGSTPLPAITIPVTEPIATDHLKTDACAGVDCSPVVGTSAAPTITLSGQAKTDGCNITGKAGATINASATDHGIAEVESIPSHPPDLPATCSTVRRCDPL